MAGEESPDWQEVARHGSILHGKLHEVSENYLKMDETLIFPGPTRNINKKIE